MNYKHIFDATVWFNTGIAQNYLDTATKRSAKDLYDNVNFRISYRTSTDKFMKGSSVYATAKSLDGLNAYTAGFDRTDISGRNKVYLFFKSMYRKGLNDLPYLLLPNEWAPGLLNNTLNIGLEHSYNYKSGTGNINIGMRTSAIMSDYDYQALKFTTLPDLLLLKIRTIHLPSLILFHIGRKILCSIIISLIVYG